MVSEGSVVRLLLFFILLQASPGLAEVKAGCPLASLMFEKEITPEKIDEFSRSLSMELPDYQKFVQQHNEALLDVTMDSKNQAAQEKFEKAKVALSKKREHLLFVSKWLRLVSQNKFEDNADLLRDTNAPAIDATRADYFDAKTAVRTAANIKLNYEAMNTSAFALTKAVRFQVDIQEQILIQEKNILEKEIDKELNRSHEVIAKQLRGESQEKLNKLRARVVQIRENIGREIQGLDSKLRDEPQDKFLLKRKAECENEIENLNKVLKREKIPEKDLLDFILDGKNVDQVFDL